MPEKTNVSLCRRSFDGESQLVFHQLEAAAVGNVWFALATNQTETLLIVSVFPCFPSETSLLVGGNI